MVVLSEEESVCVTMGTDNAAGAQTERPGAAQAGEDFSLAARTSPAAFFQSLLSCSPSCHQ
jgi:hypothetical protein